MTGEQVEAKYIINRDLMQWAQIVPNEKPLMRGQ